MSNQQYITVRETAQILGITEKKVMDLITEEKLQAYQVADQFLRLKRAEVVSLKNTGSVVQESVQFSYTSSEKLQDFFYYNDFYLASIIIIFCLLYIIFFI